MAHIGHFCLHNNSIALTYPSQDVARAFDYILGGFRAEPTRPAIQYSIQYVPQTGGYLVANQDRLIGNYATLPDLVTAFEWHLITQAVDNAKTPDTQA